MIFDTSKPSPDGCESLLHVCKHSHNLGMDEALPFTGSFICPGTASWATRFSCLGNGMFSRTGMYA